MKTSITLSAIATFIIMTTFVAASVYTQPNLIVSGSAGINAASLTLVKSDGEPVKAKKSSLVDNDNKTLLPSTPVAEEINYDYLKFDVNNYITTNESEITDLPASELEYLRFDVNMYIEQNPVSLEEMPADEFDYLRFDVNKYIKSDNRNGADLGELPIAE